MEGCKLCGIAPIQKPFQLPRSVDCLSDIHLYSLHYVFMPRINHALEEFVRQYNNHPHLTPIQLHSVSPVTATVE